MAGSFHLRDLVWGNIVLLGNIPSNHYVVGDIRVNRRLAAIVTVVAGVAANMHVLPVCQIQHRWAARSMPCKKCLNMVLM
jgi:hypothetical protein